MNNDSIVIRPGALGDAVLTLPVLLALRAEGARRTVVLGHPANWRWLSPLDDTVTIADWNGSEWLGLFSPDVDLAESARRQLEGIPRALVYLRSGAEVAADALGETGVGHVLTALPPTWPEHPDEAGDERHAAERLLSPLGERAITLADLNAGQSDEPLLKVTDDERATALASVGLDRPPAEGFFAIHPGSGGESKCWPFECFLELLQRVAERSPMQPLVFVGPVELERMGNAVEKLSQETCVARSLPLRQVMALLSMARIFIGNDAGITHLAGRCCPTIQLFGATRPYRWKALGPDVTVIEAPQHDLAQLTVDAVWSCDRMDGMFFRQD